MDPPWKRRLAALAAAAAIASGAFAFHLVTAISGLLATPPTPTAQRAYEASRPAIALIQVDATLHTTVAEPVLSTAGSRLLAHDGATTAALAAALSNPVTNVAAGTRLLDETFYERTTGTGFFVTEDGRMVTASHVVTPLASDLSDRMQQDFEDPSFTAGVDADILGSIVAGVPGFVPGAAARAAIAAWLPGYLRKNTTLVSMERQIAVAYGTASAGDRLMTSGDHAEVVTADSPYPGKDVAIIRVGVTGAVPALAVSQEAFPAEHETSNLIGYGPPLDSAANAAEPPREARLETGTVLSYEDHADFTAYSTDAVSRPGDSGGPVLDKEGRVIGMLSYSATGESGQALYGENYFIPASVIRQDMARVRLRPPPAGKGITDAYYRALAAADQQHYRDAVELLAPIPARAPGDLEVRAALEADRAAIAAGNDRTPFHMPWSLAGLGVALLAISVIWVLALWRVGPPARAPAAEGSSTHNLRR